MMPNAKSGHLAWLAAVVSEQRSRVADLLRRLTGLGPRGAMKASVFRKFLDVLDQIAEAKAKETNALLRIEDIEEQHRFHRKNHSLRQASSTPKPAIPADPEELGCERPGHGLLWLVAFCYLFMRDGMNKKKQGLTVD